MAKSFNVHELRFSAEASFAENVNSLSSNTYTTRLPCIGLPTVTLMQERIPDGTIQNAVNQSRPGISGPREATLEFTVNAMGYGSSTASGALSANWLYTLLSKGLGTGNTADSGSTVAGSTDADTYTTAANPADFIPGSIQRVGVIGDARGGGAAAVVTSVSGTTVELTTALPAAPNASDVVYGSIQAYPYAAGFTDAGGTTQTLRFVCSKLDTGAQWHMVGCQLEGITYSGGVAGQIPTLTFRYRCAYWDRVADTTPSVVALSDDLSSPCQAGRVYFQTVGTTTHATIAAESYSVNVDLGLIPMRAVNGTATYQTIMGYVRTHVRADVTFRIQEWASTYETLWDLDGSTATLKHILLQSNAVNGRCFGVYMPKTYIVGSRPTFEDVAGTNGVSFTMQACEGATTTSDLTKSPIRFFLA